MGINQFSVVDLILFLYINILIASLNLSSDLYGKSSASGVEFSNRFVMIAIYHLYRRKQGRGYLLFCSLLIHSIRLKLPQSHAMILYVFLFGGVACLNYDPFLQPVKSFRIRPQITDLVSYKRTSLEFFLDPDLCH